MKKMFVSGLLVLSLASCCNKANECTNSNAADTTNVAAVDTITSTCAVVLDDKTFNLTELNGTELASNAENPSQILFTAEGNIVSASVGCNTINATYKVGEKGAIAFENGLSTKMACPEGSREDEFVAAFNQVAQYEINGDVVTFFNAEGVALFRATAAK